MADARQKAVQKDLTGDGGWVADGSCFRQLMEWAGCKERFGNTPETKNRPDLSKLNPGGFRFQAMALRAILTADAVISEVSEAGVASMFGLFRAEACCCVSRSDHAVVPEAAHATKLAIQPAKVWAGPLCGPQIAQQSEKAESRQMELAPIWRLPAFSLPQTALCGFNTKLAETVC